MKTKHTPGPWRVIDKPQDKNNVPRALANDGGIAILCVNRRLGDTGPSAQELANAHLIAAAPDLLAALENMQFHAARGLPGTLARAIWDQAEAAIAKARQS